MALASAKTLDAQRMKLSTIFGFFDRQTLLCFPAYKEHGTGSELSSRVNIGHFGANIPSAYVNQSRVLFCFFTKIFDFCVSVYQEMSIELSNRIWNQFFAFDDDAIGCGRDQ